MIPRTLLSFMLLLSISSFAAPYPAMRDPAMRTSMESEILRLVNRHRQSIRLKPLQMDAFESNVAEGHSRNMASGRTPFGHDGFKQRVNTLRKRMPSIHVSAENVAMGQMSAREVVDGWLHSPGHRRNIEGDFKLTGIGLARDRRGLIYFTKIFTR